MELWSVQSIESLRAGCKAHDRRFVASLAGTAPKLQQQLEQLSRLPKAQQRLVSQLIDTVLQQHGG